MADEKEKTGSKAAARGAEDANVRGGPITSNRSCVDPSPVPFMRLA